MNAFFIIN